MLAFVGQATHMIRTTSIQSQTISFKQAATQTEIIQFQQRYPFINLFAAVTLLVKLTLDPR